MSLILMCWIQPRTSPARKPVSCVTPRGPFSAITPARMSAFGSASTPTAAVSTAASIVMPVRPMSGSASLPAWTLKRSLMVKQDAPQLLDKALAAPAWQPQPIFFSGITDAYQPVERQLELTRGCLRVLAAYHNPVCIVTKSALVTRDCDLLAQLAEDRAAWVAVSLTTLNAELARRLEPRASTPARRLAAIAALAEAGIPVGVMLAPIIPGLTDHEIPALLKAAAQAGARFAGHTIVRLPYGVSELFGQWLEDHYPERKNRVLNRVRSMRQGKLNDARWKTRMRGEGVFAESIHDLFAVMSRKAGLDRPFPQLSATAFRRPGQARQLALFAATDGA